MVPPFPSLQLFIGKDYNISCAPCEPWNACFFRLPRCMACLWCSRGILSLPFPEPSASPFGYSFPKISSEIPLRTFLAVWLSVPKPSLKT